ncbi:tripartite motif-containing protein 3-like [Saccoglossus kowalevskii]|uniref:E3 ubiquitin-protein ligase TRIM56-like n=1 Tax=Saccoglossus kowalevskii TaxID=10224 RepID=A0ABM0ME58_SACKO|nr:PREDICTED: E3 ubiquitin-protein ligase TRIM56-like [Saccoglossus kowalevskii]
MASEEKVAQALDEIREDFLTCCVCYKHYQQPKVLPCLHTFCEQCLLPLVKNTDLNLKCPTCYAPCDLGEEGVAGLKTNFFISSLLQEIQERSRSLAMTPLAQCGGCESNSVSATCIDCEQYLCNRCVRVHKNITLTRSHRVVFLNVRFCTIHIGNELKFFCETCDVLTCEDCTIVTHRMPEHVHIPIKEAADKYCKYLRKMAKMVEKTENEVSKSLAEAIVIRDKLNENFQKEKAAVRTASEEVRLAINMKENTVIDALEQESAERMKYLNIQATDLDGKHTAIVQTCNDIRKSLETECGAEILYSKMSYIKKIGKLLTEDIDIDVEENLFQVTPQIDKMTSLFENKQSVCLSQCAIEGTELLQYPLLKGQSIVLPIFTRDCTGKHLVSEHEVKAIHIKPDGTRKHMQVTDRGDGVYSVTFHGDMEGRNQIIVMIGATEVPGPPVTLQVINSLVKTIGQKGDGE